MIAEGGSNLHSHHVFSAKRGRLEKMHSMQTRTGNWTVALCSSSLNKNEQERVRMFSPSFSLRTINNITSLTNRCFEHGDKFFDVARQNSE